MSNENFEAMRAKAKECEDLVEKKEAIVMAELQQIYAKKNEMRRPKPTNFNQGRINETKLKSTPNESHHKRGKIMQKKKLEVNKAKNGSLELKPKMGGPPNHGTSLETKDN
ncbi:hypothetical protein Fmac_011167 [Flemingia macrophylla]|uniref:Uncharacterized protein n=1 Tax=Flemingia macrophylla TaxID=520843 RepID=A0ABD1MLZ1_9FABA